MTTILDPTDERTPIARQLASRSGNLDGVVGLLDIRKPRGDVFLDALETLLADHAPDATVKRYTKPTFTKPCPDELRGKVRAECDVVIEALAD